MEYLRGPSRLLQFNLALQSFCQIHDKQLQQGNPHGDACNGIEITFRPDANDFDAATGPNQFSGSRNRLILDAIAAHDVHQAGANIGGIHAATVGHTTALHRRRCTIEVLVLGPILVASVAQATALELLLGKVNEVLQVGIVAIRVNDLVCKLILQKGVHVLWKHKANDR